MLQTPSCTYALLPDNALSHAVVMQSVMHAFDHMDNNGQLQLLLHPLVFFTTVLLLA